MLILWLTGKIYTLKDQFKNMPETIFLGADHAGFELKEIVKNKLKEIGKEVEDLSPGPVDPSDDYPLIAQKVAVKVAKGEGFGILVCGSGNGICLTANKVKGVRAVLGYNTQAAKWARTDENANVLCLAGRVLKPEYAVAIVRNWLETPFSNEERHARRLREIEEMEK